MARVLKYPVHLGHNVVRCGKIVHFAEQHGTFCVWALESPSTGVGIRDRVVDLITTGTEFNDTYLEHAGSVITDGGDFVVHAFVTQ